MKRMMPPHLCGWSIVTVAGIMLLWTAEGYGAGNGFITKDGQTLFPIGFYELPKDDAQLKEMADCGVNLVRCHNRSDLDRAQAAGMMGWVPLRMELGDSNDIRKKVESLRDHPALAVWEGPDEIVDTFTAAWALYWNGTFKTKDAWFKQGNRIKI